MGRLAVIGGHSILGSGFGVDGAAAAGDPERVVEREVALFDHGTHVVLHRHGVDTYTPAHLVDHVGNLGALAAAGCDRVLAISSVGGLRAEVGVGTFLAPDDFIALGPVPSGFDDARGHTVPCFDAVWRARVLREAARHCGVPVADGGIYWQMPGPRFETRAEIRLLARFADVVGMTVASECVVAQQLGLAYAAICVVDNLANGVAEQRLTRDEFEAGKRATRDTVLGLLGALVPTLTS